VELWLASDFKALQTYWYQVLEASGFQDIELPSGALRETDHRTVARALADQKQREEYRNRASDFLHTFNFQSETEQTIWELHVDGVSVREIAIEIDRSKSSVQRTITFLRKAAYLKGKA